MSLERQRRPASINPVPGGVGRWAVHQEQIDRVAPQRSTQPPGQGGVVVPAQLALEEVDIPLDPRTDQQGDDQHGSPTAREDPRIARPAPVELTLGVVDQHGLAASEAAGHGVLVRCGVCIMHRFVHIQDADHLLGTAVRIQHTITTDDNDVVERDDRISICHE